MHSQDTPTRRQFLGSALGVLGAAAAAGAVGTAVSRSGEVVALGPAIAAPATVFAPAEALGSVGELGFPIDSTGGDLVMPNGYRSGTHKGIDLGNGCSDGHGRPLLACADAVVNSIKTLRRAGRLITLRDADDTYYRYHHLDSFVPTLAVGDAVQRGDIVGYMGSTGNTRWAHLHFEVWRSSLNPAIGHPVDPLPLLSIPRGVVIGGPSCG